jgi:hypothetical protein
MECDADTPRWQTERGLHGGIFQDVDLDPILMGRGQCSRIDHIFVCNARRVMSRETERAQPTYFPKFRVRGFSSS